MPDSKEETVSHPTSIRREISIDSSHDGTDSSDHEAQDVDELDRFSTHQSLGPDTPVVAQDSVVEIPDEVYDRLPRHRKLIIVSLLSFCSFLAPISSTSVLAASPEVAEEYDTTGSIINLSNAMFMLFMGISPMVWGPVSTAYGRRWVTNVTAFAFFGCSIGTALAPNLAAFFVFRILTAFEGTSFILVGSAVIGDIYRATERATALGWFLSGTLIGPALGPFLGGLIVTYTTWRVIFWLQTGLSGLALMGTFFLLPETIYHKRIDDLAGYSGREKTKALWRMISPWRVLSLFEYPNFPIAGLASSALLWNMYSILSSIRYVLNPRFALTSPLQGGLFYLAPGCGYLIGSFFGGRWADRVVRQYIVKRGGVRVPEDRLYSALPFMAFIAACMLVYGWTIEKDVGGIPLAVILLFLQGLSQLFCFPSLNTYCLDVMPGRSAEVVAGNYVIRYLFACAATGAVVPAIAAIGVGWFSTISAFIMLLGAGCILIVITFGKKWRERIGAKKKAQRHQQRQRQAAREEVDEAGNAAAKGDPTRNTMPEAQRAPVSKEEV